MAWRPGPNTCPHLVGAVVVLDCDLHDVLTVGDHELVIGAVVAVTVPTPDPDPLLFAGGRFRALARSTPVQLPGLAQDTGAWERTG